MGQNSYWSDEGYSLDVVPCPGEMTMFKLSFRQPRLLTPAFALALSCAAATAECHTITVVNVGTPTLSSGSYTKSTTGGSANSSFSSSDPGNYTQETYITASNSISSNGQMSLTEGGFGSFTVSYTWKATWTPDYAGDIPSAYSDTSHVTIWNRVQGSSTATVSGTYLVGLGGTGYMGYHGSLTAYLTTSGIDYEATAVSPVDSGSTSTQNVTVATASGTWDGPVADTPGVTWVLQPDGTYVGTFTFLQDTPKISMTDSGDLYFGLGMIGSLGMSAQYQCRKQLTVKQIGDVSFTPWL